MQKLRTGIAFVLSLILLLIVAGKALDMQSSGPMGEEHPGYFEQWLREKKPANGEFPYWMRQKWAAWDRSHVRSRSAEDIIEQVYELGPADVGGRTRAVWIDPRNENILLAGAISGGMWRSENGGSTWKPINDHETSLMPSCITSNPFNPDIVYYGTGEGRGNSSGYFVRSVDGNGVYKSTDGGKTFQSLPSTVGLSGFETIWDIQHSPDDSNTVFVGTHAKGLWRSTDGGSTWQQVFNGGNSQVNQILTLPGNRVLISMQSNLVYASDSGGKAGTFSAVAFPDFPGPGSYRRIQMAACKKYPEVCYAIVEAFNFSDSALAFYKSRDAGRTWQKMTRPARVGASYQGYCLMLGVHPEDSLRVVAGGVNIGQTDDGGKTWKRKRTGHSDHHAFAAFPQTTGDFMVGTDGGVYRYAWNDEAVKQNLNNGYNVTQFYAGDFGRFGAVSISGAQDNGTHVATGELQSKKFFGADGAYAHIGLQDGRVAYISSQDTGIRRIRNFDPAVPPKNADIQKILDQRFRSDGVDFINAYAMNPADQKQLYYRTDRFLYRSKDEGSTWDRLSFVHSGLKAIAVSEDTDPVVYFGGSGAQLYRINNAASTNTQGTEQVFNSKVPVAITSDFLNAITISPANRNTLYLAFSNFSNEPRAWKVENMDGADPVFTSISGDLPPSLPVNFIATDPAAPDKNLFAATDFGLYYSTDSGKTWLKELRIPNVAVHEIKMRKDRILFVYTHGRGMWALQLKGATPLLSKSVRMVVYPNPGESEVKISLPVYGENNVAEVFNTAGQKVYEYKFSGSSARFEHGLAGGNYFVRVTAGGRRFVEKLIVR